MKRILLVGGGSGGHVYPLVAVAEELEKQSKEKGINLEILFLGEGGFFERATKEKGYNFKQIMSGKLRRYISPLTIIDILKMPVGFLQSIWHIFWFMPDLVFIKGGAVSFSPAIVSWLYLIPVYIHESDAIPGLANKIIAKFASKIFVAFESTKNYFKASKVEYVGSPVRKSLLNGDRNQASSFFNLKNDINTILVLGGSQGAKVINDAILDDVVLLTDKFQVIHQCGEGQYNIVKSSVDKIMKEGEQSYGAKIKENYRLYPFFNTEQMALVYAMADVIISRAGAGLIFEIASLGKPAILIPLINGSRGEQLNNALELSKFGAVVIEEDNLTRNIIINQVEHLLANSNSISEKIKGFIKSDSSTIIASLLISNA